MTRSHDKPHTAFVTDDNRSVLVVYVHKPEAIIVVTAAITRHYPLADVHTVVNIEHGGFALVASVKDVHADELWNDVSKTVPADIQISRHSPGCTRPDMHGKSFDE